MDIISLMREAHTHGAYGPWVVMLSCAWRDVLKKKYVVGHLNPNGPHEVSINIRERLLMIQGVCAVTHSDSLVQWEVCLAQVVCPE